MPDNFGNLNFGGGFGGRAPHPADAFMPSLADVEKARRQGAEEQGLIWKILQVPERLLGGQMIKGFIEGTARGGIGEGLRKAAVNNPLAQLIEGIPGVDGIVEDTSFSDIRKAFGDNSSQEGFGNFVINLAGELLTSPLELFWSPWAKLRLGSEAAEVAAKGRKLLTATGTLDKLAPSALSFAADVAADGPVRRALLTFKIPFTQSRGFLFQPFKNADVFMSRALEGTVNALNSNPATRAILSVFKHVNAGIGSAAERNYLEGTAVEAAMKAGRLSESQFIPALRQIINRNPNLTAEEQQAVLALISYRATQIDNAADLFSAVRMGPQVQGARLRTGSLLKDPAGYIGALALENGDLADEVMDLVGRVKDPTKYGTADEVMDLINRWQRVLPEHALPKEVVDYAEAATGNRDFLRPGVDIMDWEAHSTVPRSVRAAASLNETLGKVDGSFVSAAKVGDGTADSLTRQGQEALLTGNKGVVPGPSESGKKMAEAAATVTPSTPESIFQARETVVSLFGRIINDKGFDYVKKLQAVADQGVALMEGLRIADQATGVLRSTLEGPYIPRELHPDVKRALNAQAGKFFKGREFTELTEFEVNAQVMEWGSRLTGFKPVKYLKVDGNDTTILDVLATHVFPESFLKSLRATGRKTGNKDFEKAAEFLWTNPYQLWYRRIEKSIKAQKVAGYKAAIFDPDGPIYVDERSTTASDFPSWLDASLKDPDVRPFMVVDDLPGTARPVANGDLIDEALQLNNRASYEVAARQIRDVRNGRLESIRGKAVAPDGDLAEVNVLLGEMRSLRDLTLDDVFDEMTGASAKIPDSWKQTAHWKNMVSRIEAVSRLRGLKANTVALERKLGSEARQFERAAAGSRRTAEEALRGMAAPQELLDELDALGPEVFKSPQGSKVVKKNATLLQDLEDTFALAGDYAEDQAAKGKAKRADQTVVGTDYQISREHLSALRAQGRKHADTLQQEINAIDGLKKSIVKKIVGDSKERLGALKAIFNDPARRGQVIDDFQVLLAQERHGVLPLDVLRRENPSLYERVTKGQSGRKVVLLKSEPADAVFREGGMLDQLFNPTDMAQWMSFLDKPTHLWKSWTVLNPLHVRSNMRNWLSGIFMAMQGGAPIMRQPRAMHYANQMASVLDAYLGKDSDVQRATYAGVDAAKEIAFPDGRKFKHQEVISAMMRGGVWGSGVLLDELGRIGETAFSSVPGHKPGKFKELLMHKFLGNYGGRILETTDAHSRLTAVFAHLLDNPKLALDDAVALVKPWVYDPANVTLSATERSVFRRLIPFYSFAKVAITTQINAAMARPASVTWFEKLHRSAVQAANMDEQQYETFIPEYIRDQMGVPMSRDKDGYKLALLGSLFPIGEVTGLVQAISDTFGDQEKGGIVDYIGSKLNPWIQKPLQGLVNRSFYTQQPMEAYPGQKVEYMGMPVTPFWRDILRSVRILNDIDKLNIFSARDARVIMQGRGAVQRNERIEKSFMERLLTTSFTPLVPAPVVGVNLQDQANRQAAAQERERSMLKYRLGREVTQGDPATKEANKKTIQKLLADVEARMQARAEVEAAHGLKRRN